MREVRAVALAVLALLGAVAVVAPAPAAVPGTPSSTGSQQGAAAVSTPVQNNSTMGSDVSSFMQSSAGQAEEEVEAGMWNAAYENASNRTRVVQRRTGSIDGRLADLQAEKRRTVRAYRNGSITRVEYRARMARVVGRMAALNRSIETTARQADATGVDPAAVDRLREQMGNLSGPEIAAIARSLAGGPPADLPRNATGAPDDVGPPDNRSGPPDGSAGPPDDGQQSQGNQTQGGPPDDGTGDGQGTGNNQGNANSYEVGSALVLGSVSPFAALRSR